MMNILEQFYETISSDATKTEKNHVTEQSIEWVNLLSIPTQNMEIGVAKEGYWIVKREEKVIPLKEERMYMYCYSILEIPIEEIKEKLNLNYSKNFNDFQMENIFPFYEIVKFTFNNVKSDYWIGLALKWYVQLNMSFKKKLANEMVNISADKNISQSNRHFINKELRKLNRD